MYICILIFPSKRPVNASHRFPIAMFGYQRVQVPWVLAEIQYIIHWLENSCYHTANWGYFPLLTNFPVTSHWGPQISSSKSPIKSHYIYHHFWWLTPFMLGTNQAIAMPSGTLLQCIGQVYPAQHADLLGSCDQNQPIAEPALTIVGEPWGQLMA